MQRKIFESAQQSKNISRSEFLPNITLSGDQTSTNTNRTNQSGSNQQTKFCWKVKKLRNKKSFPIQRHKYI